MIVDIGFTSHLISSRVDLYPFSNYITGHDAVCIDHNELILLHSHIEKFNTLT